MDYNIGSENLFSRALNSLKMLFIPFEGNNWTPKFLQSKMLFYAVVFVLVVKIVAVGLSLPLPPNWFFADITKTDLLVLLNHNRQAIGATPLVENSKLDEAARLKAQDMVAKGYFAHQSPQGLTPWYWFRQAGYNYKYAGENLAVGFLDSTEVFTAWMNSPGHRANLDNPNYREVGTAILSGFQGNSTIVVQVFGSQPAAVKPATPVATTQKPPVTKTPAPKPAPTPTPQPKPEPVIEPAPQPTPGPQSPINSQGTVVQNPAAGQQVLAGETEIAEAQPGKTIANNAYGSFVNFIVYDYQKLMTYLILVFLILVSFASFLNIMVNFSVQREHLIATSMVMVMMLFCAFILNPALVSQVIPHQLVI
ncbi:hypothetical protein KW786_03925 [Candidatus Parcubacteria bacterium]|nr:hypothetical protein [Candidatus Parcubacteria bacterium]